MFGKTVWLSRGIGGLESAVFFRRDLRGKGGLESTAACVEIGIGGRELDRRRFGLAASTAGTARAAACWGSTTGSAPG